MLKLDMVSDINAMRLISSLMGSINSTVNIELTGTEMSARIIDETRVVYEMIVIDQSLFDSFKLESDKSPTYLGMDFSKLAGWIGKAGEGEKIYLSTDGEQIVIRLVKEGNTGRKFSFGTIKNLPTPKKIIPTKPYTFTTVLNTQRFMGVLSDCSFVSNEVVLDLREEDILFTAGEAVAGNVEIPISWSSGIFNDTKWEDKSLTKIKLNIDYLGMILGVLGSIAGTAEFEYAVGNPIRIKPHNVDMGKIKELTYFLAPVKA